jgi:hypothetical protein
MVGKGRSILAVCGAWMIFATALTMLGLPQRLQAVRPPETRLLTKEEFNFKLRDQKSRQGRKEGILRQRPVSGGVDLISATIEYRDRRPPQGLQSCFVGFFLPEESQVKITVQEPEKLYRMTPDRVAFDSGFSNFAWPAGAVLEPLNISLYDLYAVAEIKESMPLRIAPVVLYYRNPPADTIKGYRFIIRTGARADFKYRILRSDSSGYSTLHAGQLRDQPAGEVLITWDGRDQSRRFVGEGLCQLKIDINPQSRYKKGRTVIFMRDFYHKCMIRQSR